MDPPWPCGYEAWFPRVSSHVPFSPLSPQAGRPGRYIHVRCCEVLSMLLQVKDPLELFVKRREFRPGSGCLSPGDMTYKPIPSSYDL